MHTTAWLNCTEINLTHRSIACTRQTLQAISPANQILNPFQPPQKKSSQIIIQNTCHAGVFANLPSLPLLFEPWPVTFQRHWKRSNRCHGSWHFHHGTFSRDLGHLGFPPVPPTVVPTKIGHQKHSTKCVMFFFGFCLERTEIFRVCPWKKHLFFLHYELWELLLMKN